MRKLHTRPAPRRRAIAAGAALLSAVAATLISAAPSAVAADITIPFQFGTGTSHIEGTFGWHLRSFDVDYTVTTKSCAQVYLSTHTADGTTVGLTATPQICHGTKSGNIVAEVPATVAYVNICLSDISAPTVCRKFDRP